MNGNRRNDQNKDDDRDDNRDDGPSFFGLAVAGAAIGAALYGASKLFGSNDSSNRERERVYGDGHGSKRPGVIKVIQSEQECVSAIVRIEREAADYPAVGLDCEWQNNWDGTCEKVATLSVCTAKGFSAIFCLRKWNSIPSRLKVFLNNAKILKVGVGMDRDADKLQTDCGVRLVGFVDLRFLAKKYGHATRSLTFLARDIADITLVENDHSNWNADPLSRDDVEYAAMDVYSSIEILKELVPSKNRVSIECAPFVDEMFRTNMNNF